MISDPRIITTYLTQSHLPHALESHQGAFPAPLDPEADIDTAVQLVQLASNPWYFGRKIHLVA